MRTRQCAYCGKYVDENLSQCPFCREELGPAVAVPSWGREEGKQYIRRGLLYMLMAAVIHYFASGFAPVEIPVQVPEALTQYLLPFLFLLGLGLVAYGLYRRLRR